MRKLILALALAIFTFTACIHEPVIPDAPEPEGISFKNHIQPFLLSTCALAGCHIGENAAGDVDLSSYELVIETADVKAGNPDGSKLYEKLVEDSPSEVMPPGSPLPPAQIETVRLWIEQGAKDN